MARPAVIILSTEMPGEMIVIGPSCVHLSFLGEKGLGEEEGVSASDIYLLFPLFRFNRSRCAATHDAHQEDRDTRARGLH